MRILRLVLPILLLAACGEQLDDPAASPASPDDLLAVAHDRGYPDDAIAFVERVPADGLVHHLELSWHGVRVVGIGAVTGVTAQPRVSSPRLELDDEPVTTPSIARQAAEARALAAFSAADAARANDAELVLVPTFERRMRADADASGREPTATDFERVIRRLDLRWRVEVETGADDDHARWFVDVDALTGEAGPARTGEKSVITAPPGFAVASGASTYDGTQSIIVKQNDWTGFVSLADVHGNIVTAYARDGGVLPVYSSGDASFGDGALFQNGDPAGVNGETAAVDAYLATDATWKMFANVLGVNAPYGDGVHANVRVHYRQVGSLFDDITHTAMIGYTTVTATGPLHPLSSVDVVGHELGHGFFAHETGTDGQNETIEFGALDESTGDVIGTLAENYRKVAWGQHVNWPLDQIPADGDFVIGTGTGWTIRSMIAPQFWNWSPTLDEDAVWDPHLVAGPVDRAFYVLADGLSPVPVTGFNGDPRTSKYLPAGLAPLGLTKAAVMWRQIVSAWRDGDDFADARDGALENMETIYGWDSEEKKDIADAFAAVNIGLPADRTPPTILPRPTAVQTQTVVRIAWSIDEKITRKSPELTIDGTYHYLPGIAGKGQSSWTVDVPVSAIGGSGTHNAVIQVWDDWGNLSTASVKFTDDATGPTLSVVRSGPIKQPTLTATASDPAGVARVEFVRDGVLVASALNAPYAATFDTSTWADGPHTVITRAYDTFGNSSAIATGITADNTPPAVIVTVDGASSPFTIGATTTDASAISQVQFFRDTTLLATDTTAPFSASYAPQDAAPHTITVKATDGFGNVGATVISAPLDGVAPVVTFTASQHAYTVTLAGSVTDPCGITSPYTMIVDGVQIATPSGNTYSVALPTALFLPGIHTFELDVSDRCGNARAYTSTFPVYTNTPLVSVAIADGADKKHPHVLATVTHDRPIDHVEVWRDNGAAMVGSDSTAPYDITLDTSTWTSGSHDLHVVAIDNLGLPGEAWTSVVADNTAPTTHSTWSQVGRAITFTANNVSDGTGSGVVGIDLWIWANTSHFVPGQGPYTIQWVLAPGYDTGQAWYGANATDAYGNVSDEEIVVHISCTTTNGHETCTAQQQ